MAIDKNSRNTNNTLRIKPAKKLTFDIPTPDAYLSPIIEVNPTPDFTSGLVSLEENAQQTKKYHLLANQNLI